MELQIVRQTLRKKKLSSQRALKGLKVRRRLLRSRWRQSGVTQEQPRPLRQSVRVTVPPIRYGWDEDHVSFALVTETGEPDSYNEAIEADDHNEWITAMEQEMESLV